MFTKIQGITSHLATRHNHHCENLEIKIAVSSVNRTPVSKAKFFMLKQMYVHSYHCPLRDNTVSPLEIHKLAKTMLVK
jgi:hypothetical protein